MNTGNIIAFWQDILRMDSAAGGPCLDGKFGPVTDAWTHAWQQRRTAYATNYVVQQLQNATHFYVDGVVGPQTWTMARLGAQIIDTSVGITPGSTVLFYRYTGTVRSFDGSIGYTSPTSPLDWNWFDSVSDVGHRIDHPTVDWFGYGC